MEKGKLKILFRIPFCYYYVALVKFNESFFSKRFLCLCTKEFDEDINKYYFAEIAISDNIEDLILK